MVHLMGVHSVALKGSGAELGFLELQPSLQKELKWLLRAGRRQDYHQAWKKRPVLLTVWQNKQ